MTENKNDINFSDDDLRGLFENFNPELNPDKEFLHRFEKNIDMLDKAAEYGAMSKAAARKNAAWAALGGFIAGIISTLLMPYIVNIIMNLLPAQTFEISGLLPGISILSWIFVGAITLITTILIYSSLNESPVSFD